MVCSIRLHDADLTQDEREAQRKLEHKRELERKRIAQQEEERKREQHRAEQELQRQREQDAAAEDPKKIAQKQAIERRRLENAKKHEQPRNAPMHTRAKAGAELVSNHLACLHATVTDDIDTIYDAGEDRGCYASASSWRTE